MLEEIAAAGGRAIAVKADVANKTEVEAMAQSVVAEFGGLDVLVNNAGICPFHEFVDMPEELWDRVQDVNLKGVFLCSQAAAKVMIEQGRGGRIISISSISALVGGGMQTHYTPTKAGIHSLMQSLAIVLGPHGITCNSVLPGAIATDINREDLSDPEKLAYLSGASRSAASATQTTSPAPSCFSHRRRHVMSMGQRCLSTAGCS